MNITTLNRVRYLLPLCLGSVLLFFLCSCMPLGYSEFWNNYATGSHMGYLELTVQEAGSNRLLSGVIVQLIQNNVAIAQQRTNSQGVVTFRNIDAGTYTIQAWNGSLPIKDTIYIKGPVRASMRI